MKPGLAADGGQVSGRKLLNSIKTVCQRLDRSRTYVYGLITAGVFKTVYVGASQMIPENGEGSLQAYYASLVSADNDAQPLKTQAATEARAKQRAAAARAGKVRRVTARRASQATATSA